MSPAHLEFEASRQPQSQYPKHLNGPQEVFPAKQTITVSVDLIEEFGHLVGSLRIKAAHDIL